MDNLLFTPGLPSSKVTSAVVSCENKSVISALNTLGIDVLELPRNPKLEYSICSHADCELIQLSNTQFFLDNSIYDNIVNFLTSKIGLLNIQIKTIGESIKSPYPDDIRLNCKIIGNRIICNTKHVADEIIKFSLENDIELIHVNQGYAACSTIVLNDSALITDDISIHNSVIKNGIDTLLITKGSVKLRNHEYGFIGGTCGFIDKNLLAFTGSLESHNDADSIIKFLNKYCINYLNLTNGNLTDIGGIIPLTQKA